MRSQQTLVQLTEVINYFNLSQAFGPFTRCMACNGSIAPVAKENILTELPPKTRRYFHHFFKCQVCQRIYWQGSHYDRMQQSIQKLSTEQ